MGLNRKISHIYKHIKISQEKECDIRRECEVYGERERYEERV